MKERVRIVKFGGSTLKNTQGLQKIVEVVRSYDSPLIIVVSAFYGITNKIQVLLDDKILNNSLIDCFIEYLSKMKKDLIHKNFHQAEIIEEVIEILDQRLEELDFLLHEFQNNTSDKSYYDAIIIYGELLSSLIITSLLKDNGIDVQEMLPEKIGLITDGTFNNASVSLNRSSQNIVKVLSDNKTYVIPGFYGVSDTGKKTILGRGGTDYSAAAIAYCMNAESLDVWKDVNGFMSANPKYVEGAREIKFLSYPEAAELAYFGAKILHPGTIEPLQKKNIPLRIFNIVTQDTCNNPKSVINGKSIYTQHRIKSVTYSDDFAILKLKGSSVGIKPGILARVATALDCQQINIKSVITSQIVINLLLAKKDIFKAEKIITDLGEPEIQNVIANPDIALIAVVGEGITEKQGIASKVFNAVASKEINVQMIAFGASHVSSYFIVNINDKKKTVRLIHSELFEDVNKEELKIINQLN